MVWDKEERHICVTPDSKTRTHGWNPLGDRAGRGLLSKGRSDGSGAGTLWIQAWRGAVSLLCLEPQGSECSLFLPRLHRALHHDNVSVNLFVVNKPWLFSLLWCAGVDSVTTNDCQLLQQMRYPVWLIVRAQGLSPLLLFSYPCFSLTLFPSSLLISPRIHPLDLYMGGSGHWQGPFSFLTARSNLPDNMDHYQLCLPPAAFMDFPPTTVSPLRLSFLGLHSP